MSATFHQIAVQEPAKVDLATKLELESELRLRVINELYGEPYEIVPAEPEELFCICLGPESGTMVECSNVSRCLAQWFHISCVYIRQVPKQNGMYVPHSKF